MAITWAASLPAVGANNGGNVTLTFSNFVNAAGGAYTLVTGDIVFVAYAASGTADLAMAISWSGGAGNSINLGEHYSNGTLDTNIACFAKTMGATPDTTCTVTGPTGASNGTIAVAHVIKGADIAALDTAAITAAGTATSVPNPGAVLPVTAGAFIAVIGAGAAAAGATFGHTDLNSTTNHFRTGNHAETNDIAIGFGWKENWASGSFDPAVWTGGNANASNSWAALTLAIKPTSAPVHATTGALTGQIGSVAGSAVHRARHTTSGTLTAQGSTLAGSAAHKALHATTGALTGQLGSIAGSSARTRQHATTGALTGPGATIAGSAARTRAHVISGVLAGLQAEVVGSAARTGSTVTHDTSGALAGLQAAIIASAARAGATHGTSGALTGPGALLVALTSVGSEPRFYQYPMKTPRRRTFSRRR